MGTNGAWTTRLENAKNLAQVLALCAAAAWAVVTYVVPEYLRPDDYRPHLLVTSNVKNMQILPNRASIDIKIEIFNDSNRFLRNLASHYEITGIMHNNIFSDLNIDRITKKMNLGSNSLERWHSMDRDMLKIVGVGRIMPDFWWLAPGEKYVTQISISMPRDVRLIQTMTSSVYHQGHTRKFRSVWKNKDGRLWPIVEISEGGRTETFDPKSTQHEKVASKHDLQLSVSTVETSIPWRDDVAGDSEIDHDGG